MTGIGVFIDGGWWTHLRYYLDRVDGRYVDFAALGEALGRRLGGRVCQMHYVRGRVTANTTPFDLSLQTAGVVRHDVPVFREREVGADVTLALLAYEAARAGEVGTVVLVSGDGDLAPAVEWARKAGARVVVPDVRVPDLVNGGQVAVSHLLGEAADDTVDLMEVFTVADADPEVLPVLVGGSSEGAAGAPGKVRRGRISRVAPDGTHGFIDDYFGQRWYVSGTPLPGEARTAELKVGARVVFTPGGTEPGRSFPRAFTLRPDTEGRVA